MNTTRNRIARRMMGTLSLCLFAAAAFGQSLSLQQLTDSALQHNIAMRTARHDIAAAQQQRREAFTKYFPNVSATGAWFNADKGTARMEIDPSSILSPDVQAALTPTLAQMLPAEALAALSSPFGLSMMKNGSIAGITALQPVFAGGQIVNGNRLARVGEEASELMLQLSANEVEKTVSEYYWQLVSLEEKMNTIAAAEALLADIYKDVDVAVRAGVAMRNDLLQVELRQNEVESQKAKLQNGISVLKLLLAQYCGLTPTPSPTGEGSNYSFNVAVPDINQQDYSLPSPIGVGSSNSFNVAVPNINRQDYSLPSPVGEGAGVRLLPEYQLLQKQVEAAELQKKMAVGQLLPTVAVGAGYNSHTLLDSRRSFAMVFATVSVPISDWWGGSHNVKRKKIEQQKAEEQLADNAELLSIRAQKSRNDADEARQQVAIARRGIKQAEENLRLNRDYYRVGTSTMSDLLQAQLLHQQACDRHTEASADLQHKLLLYRQAVGISRSE